MLTVRTTVGRRALVALGTIAVLAFAVAAPALASTSSFKAVILEDFGIRASAEPCWEDPVGVYCPGRGTVQGYGTVTSTILFPYAGEPLERTLVFADGSTLSLRETWMHGHAPGRSTYAPGQAVSAGNPWSDHYAWSVAGGTGAFAGASGSGTWQNVLAGDTIVIRFSGTLTLP